MDPILVISKLQKKLKDNLQTVGDTMISGGIDNMEKYKYLLGQAHAIQLTLQEISNLLENKEQKDEQRDNTNVIELDEIPKNKSALLDKYKSEPKDEVKGKKRIDETNVDSIFDQLPEPSGYRLLVLPFTPKDKTKGGIIVAQETLDRLRIAVNCGYVLKMGPEA